MFSRKPWTSIASECRLITSFKEVRTGKLPRKQRNEYERLEYSKKWKVKLKTEKENDTKKGKSEEEKEENMTEKFKAISKPNIHHKGQSNE